MALCYKDRSYCSSDCVNKKCSRYISEELVNEAYKFGLPIASIDMSKTCGDYIARKD